MRTNRRRNWLIRRIALGLAVAAIAVPVAQAKVDEGGQTLASTSQFIRGPHDAMPSAASSDNGLPRALPSDYVQLRGDKIEVVRSVPRSTGFDIFAADYGMPRAMPNDYALSSGDQIEVVRAEPRSTSSDKIEFVRSKPRPTGEPQVVATGFDWQDAGIGAGLALALVLLGGGAALATRKTGREQTA
jgi:hypothetical protein